MLSRIAGVLLSGVAFAAVAGASPAFAQETTTSEPVYTPITGEEDPTRPLHGTINPFYGTIDPFHGTINPFYGNIDAFWGTLSPFYGNIGAFWGSLNPFYGDITAFTGNIIAFDGAPPLSTIGNYWKDFGAYWQSSAPLWNDPLKGLLLTASLNDMITRTELLWGTAVTTQTGQTFTTAFLNPLLARHGINRNDARTLQALSPEQRARFFVDWYDSLMGFAGIDRPDHWMRTVNWTPAVTQQQGSGADSIIGLLDATVTGDPDIADNVAWAGGSGATVNGHGVGVASLMVAAHDRRGVMGIAPNATVIAYNPFDSTNTATWTAVRQGVLSLASRGASVINMSLGSPGYALHPDWRKVFFDPQVISATRNVVFVMAAGNDGAAQTRNLAWDWANDPALIVVGSVDINGNISSFSNTPGNACLTHGTVCQESLMNRFMVAPGELILVPDGQGGLVRRSGTSFAAPLVSGAITLLHDRWPWLAQHPRETVEIMLRSARDLGAPGVDPVYGHGLLDVTASQSPLSFNNLSFVESRNGVLTQRTATGLLSAGVDTTWQTDGVFFYLYENIGSTYRDFAVPMSTLLAGQVRTDAGMQHFQRFVQSRMTDWLRSGGTGFTDVTTVEMLATPRLRVSVSGSSPEAWLMMREGAAAPHSAMRITDTGSNLAFAAGHGEGAMALNMQPGLALSSDHGRDGGVNPLLALASGGAFASVDMPIARGTTFSFGVTQQSGRQTAHPLRPSEQAAYFGLDRYQADAMNLRISHQAARNVVLSGSYARVREHNALLGVQSRNEADFGRGATSETATVSASLASGGFTFAASGTLGRTRAAGDPEQGFRTEGQGVISTAFALSATRQGVIGRSDALRVSLLQPLHIERGELSYRSVQVIDRETGELGVLDQSFALNGDPRTVAAELLYTAPILSGGGEIGLFGRAEMQTQGDEEINQFALGSHLSLRF